MTGNDSMDKRKDDVNTTYEKDHIWAILCHLSALAMCILPIVGQIVGPLMVWLVKKNDMPLVDEEE